MEVLVIVDQVCQVTQTRRSVDGRGKGGVEIREQGGKHRSTFIILRITGQPGKGNKMEAANQQPQVRMFGYICVLYRTEEANILSHQTTHQYPDLFQII